MLGAASAREAVAIASAPDPAMAWFEGTDAAGSAEGGRRIARNNGLFDAWGLGSVPLTVWRAASTAASRTVSAMSTIIAAWLGGAPS